MELLFPDICHHIDWTKKPKFLDKELAKLIKENTAQKRYADKLIEASLKNGKQTIFLIHIEVQGYKDNFFTKRMFQYFYRIYDKYEKDILSLVVFIDQDRDYCPNVHNMEFMGCKLYFEFLTTKLINLDWKTLEIMDNPFALIVMAQIKSVTEKDPVKRKDWKISAIRSLRQKNYSKDMIKELLYFIDWLVTLPPEIEEIYIKESENIKEEETMAYITTFERHAMKKGYKIGFDEGIEKGEIRGFEKGIEKAVFSLLEIKYGEDIAKSLFNMAYSYVKENSFDNLKNLIKKASTREEFENLLLN